MSVKGPLEVFVQICAMIVSCGAFIAAVLTEMKYKDLNRIQTLTIEGITKVQKRSSVFIRTDVTTGLVFASTGVALLVGVVSFIGRIYASNSGGSLNPKRVFPYLHFPYVWLCFLGFMIAGIVGSFTASDWSTILNSRALIYHSDDVERLRNYLAAISGCSLAASALYGMLGTVVLFYCSTNRYMTL